MPGLAGMLDVPDMLVLAAVSVPVAVSVPAAL